MIFRVKDLGIDIVIGYGEKMDDSYYYNICFYIYVGKEILKYWKVYFFGNKEFYFDFEFID